MPEQTSDSYFERLARALLTVEDPQEAPEQLLALLTSDQLRVGVLTHCAEIAGRCIRDDRVVSPLLDLLRHTSSLVREGAIYGLEHHLCPKVLDALRAVVTEDPSLGVREAASEALEEARDVGVLG